MKSKETAVGFHRTGRSESSERKRKVDVGQTGGGRESGDSREPDGG